jgi:hypothetical protein
LPPELGILDIDSRGSGFVTAATPSVLAVAEMEFTVTVLMNDHIDPAQNTVLGTLTGMTMVQ